MTSAINTRRLFVCSCIALITSAFTFTLHGDIMQEMGQAFNFTQAQNGSIGMSIFWGMAASMLLGGFICDFLGMKNVMYLAFLSHLLGVLGMVFSKNFVDPASTDAAVTWLWASGFIMGCGNGWTEVGINPLVATMYPTKKTHYLNVLHAYWPGGIFIGGALSLVMRKQIFNVGDSQEQFLLFGQFELWQAMMGLIVIPTIIYGIMLIGSRFPVTERVESGVSNSDMLKETLRPMFILWAFCMLLTASTELGPQKWQNSVMTSTLDMESAGTMILMYTSGLMFVLRHFAGPIANRISPVGLLTCSAVLSCIGLYLLSFAHDTFTAFGYATVFGLGIAYFWPTMLGVAAERFPKGGALVLALMGTAGNLSIGFAIEEMGKIVDHYAIEHVQETAPDAVDTLLQKNDAGDYSALNENAIEDLKKATPEGETNELVATADTARRTGFSMAFRWVSLLPAILIFVFGAIALADKARGGYKAVQLDGNPNAPPPTTGQDSSQSPPPARDIPTDDGGADGSAD